jgi:PAS domain S-box-containing protein
MRLSSRKSLAEAAVEKSLDGLAIVDREGRYALWSPAMGRFFGKGEAEVLGQNPLEVFPFLREQRLDLAFERAFRGEVVTTRGIPHQDPDGTRRVYDRVYQPLRTGRGDVSGFVAVVRDTTSLHAAERARDEIEARLVRAAKAAGAVLWGWDPSSNPIAWDEKLRAIFEQEPKGAPSPITEESAPDVEDEDVVYQVDMSEASFGALLELRRLHAVAFEPGDTCFAVLHGRSDPCPDCPLRWPATRSWPRVAARRLASKPELYELVSATSTDRGARVRTRRLSYSAVTSIHEARIACLARDARLTEREQQVLGYLLLGRTLSDIALVMGVSLRTVKFHQANVLEKLGADSRADLLRLVV